MIVTNWFTRDQETELKHAINLMLELFGEANLLKDSLLPTLDSNKIKRLNWEVLPKGNHPWGVLINAVSEVTKSFGNNTQKLIEYRLKRINNYNPNFIAVGSGGFRGYVVFGFADLSIFVLESSFTGNATYIFGENWEELSQLSKSDILNNSLEKARIIHDSSWLTSLNRLITSEKNKERAVQI